MARPRAIAEMLVALPSVIRPLNEASAVVLVFVNAPLFEGPVPLRVSTLPVEMACPHKSKDVPLLTSTGPVPRAVGLPNWRNREPPRPPLLSVMPPLKLLFPDSVTTPLELVVTLAVSAPLPPRLADTVIGNVVPVVRV